MPVLVAALLTITGAGYAQLPPLRNLPEDEVRLENAFVHAWASLRLDMDSIHQGDVPPEVVDQWLAAAPNFVLVEMITRSGNVAVVLSAARQLAKRRTAEAQTLLAQLPRRYADTPLYGEFLSLRVVSGDKAYTEQLRQRLASPIPTVSVEAATVLALAGDKRGLEVLRKQVDSFGSEAGSAASVLGRVGTAVDGVRIEHAMAGGCSARELPMAAGEIQFREHLPTCHALLTWRDPFATRVWTPEGMYGAWMSLYLALARDIRSTDALKALLSESRAVDWMDQQVSDEALASRYVDAFAVFIDECRTLRGTAQKVLWPTDFIQAEQTVSLRSARRRDGLRARVESAVALLDALAKPLGYAGTDPVSYQVLTPGGQAVADGDFTTGWHLTDGQVLDLRWDAPVDVQEIRVANGCATQGYEPVDGLVVTWIHSRGETAQAVDLPRRTPYFQAVPVTAAAVSAVVLKGRVEGRKVACISEIRIVATPSKK